MQLHGLKSMSATVLTFWSSDGEKADVRPCRVLLFAGHLPLPSAAGVGTIPTQPGYAMKAQIASPKA